MVHLPYFVPLIVFGLVGTMTWTVSKYLEVEERWREQSRTQPKGRPVLAPGVVVQRRAARR